jgi:hypothetical protein
MSEFFEWAEDYVPAILWIVIWLAFLPFRLMFLLVLPKGSEKRYHALNPVFEFFAFDRG